MPIYCKNNDKNRFFFFKTKNCSNDDPFISCNDRIGKMLITSANLQWLYHSGLRAVACRPLVKVCLQMIMFKTDLSWKRNDILSLDDNNKSNGI